MNALKRIKGMMFHPAAEWNSVAIDKPGPAELLGSFLLPLGLLAPMATVIGMRAFDAGWNPDFGYSMLRERAPVIAVATYAFEIASVYLLAAVFYVLARTEGRSRDFLAVLQVAVLGSIPLLLSGAALLIPFGAVFSMIAAFYSFYLYYLGAERLIGIRESDAAMFVGVAMICMMVLSGFLGGIASAIGIF